MFGDKRTGAVVCRGCGRLVGRSESACPFCGTRSPSLMGLEPWLRRFGSDFGFVELVMGATILLYLAVAALDPRGLAALMNPSPRSLLILGASGPLPVIELGRWWTLLSAGWLHGGPLHIFFNLMWIRQLAPVVAEGYGAARMVVIYVVGSVVGFVFSTFGSFAMLAASATGVLPDFLARHLGGLLSVGASAGIFGLFGALIYWGRRGGSSHLSRQVWGWVVFFFVLGFVLSNVDNWAHLGGLAGGWVTARILDPLKPEKATHVAFALLLLLATAASLVASVLVPLPAGLG